MQQVSNILVETVLATVDLMRTVLPSVYLGLFLANLSTSGNLAEKGRFWVPIVMKVTGLSAASAISIVLSMGDRTAGMAALAEARKHAGLKDGEIIAANLVAKVPSVLQFFIFSFIPIMTSLYPREIAARFLIVYFSSFLIISFVGVLGARAAKSAQKQRVALTVAASEAKLAVPWACVVRGAAWRALRSFTTVALWMAGLSFAAMLFIKTGVLNGLAGYLPLAAYGVNANVLPAIAAGLISMLGGMAALGGAFKEGAVPPAMVVPLLLSTSLLHNFYDLFASSIPRTAAIFGRRLGVKVALWSFGVTQAVMLAAILLTMHGWL